LIELLWFQEKFFEKLPFEEKFFLSSRVA